MLRRILTTTLMLVLMGGLVVESRAEAANLVANPSFEAGKRGWVGKNTQVKVIRMARAPSGRRVAVIGANRGRFLTLDDRRASVRNPRAGDRFTAAVHIRANGAASVGAPVSLRLILRSSTGKVLKTWRKRARAPRRFTRIGMRAGLNRGGRVLEVRLSVGRPPTGRVSLRVDGFVLVKGRLGPGATGGDPSGAGGGTGAGAGGSGAIAIGDRDWESRPYGRATWLYAPRPNPFPKDPSSGSMVSALLASYAGNRPSLTGADETPPVYVSNPANPAYTLNLTRFGQELDGRIVRLPPNAVAGSGADDPLIVLDPATRIETRLWQASINHSSRVVTASSGGLFDYGPNGDGRPLAGTGGGSGLSYLNGLIRPEDVQRGVIDHALRFGANFINGQHRFPATKSDQGGGDPVPMGTRFYLDVSPAECDARTVPATGPNPAGATAFLRMICHALREHGMYAADGSSILTLYMEHDATSNWSALGIEEAFGTGNYGWIIRGQGTTTDGLGPRSASDGIPWNRFVARSAAGGGSY